MDDMDIDPTAAVPDGAARFPPHFASDKRSHYRRVADRSAVHDAESLFEQGRLARLLADGGEHRPAPRSQLKSSVSSESNTVEAIDTVQSKTPAHSNHIGHSKTMRDGKAQTMASDSRDLTWNNTCIEKPGSRNHARNADKLRDKGKGVDIRSASQALGKAMKAKGSILQWRPVQNGHTSACNLGISASSKADGQSTNFSDREACAGTSKQDDSMLISSGPPLEHGHGSLRQLHSDVPSKNIRQKKLVRNGCISPKNIAQLESMEKGKGILRASPDNLSIAATSKHMKTRCSISNEGSRDRKKREVRSNGHLEDHQLGPVLARPKIHSSFNEEAVVIADVADDSLSSETMLDHVEQTPRNESHGSDTISNAPSPVNTEPALQHGQEDQIKGKRKCSLVQSNVDESSSTYNMEVERKSPLRNSHYSESSITQVESDEILARRLQEQFNQESTIFGGTEEDDATIAWTLQQDDADHAGSITRQGHSYARDQSADNLYRYRQRFPSRNSSAQLTNITRFPTSNRRFNSPEMDHEMTLISQLTRGFRSHQMDLDTRLDILEALEDAYEDTDGVAISDDLFPDFWDSDSDGDEYEMLLALDDNDNQHAGASDMEIHSLPVSVIQIDNSEDPCPICLEPPSAGAAIRHLPCLHKFHKECIDTWLRRRASCPVCKSGIT